MQPKTQAIDNIEADAFTDNPQREVLMNEDTVKAVAVTAIVVALAAAYVAVRAKRYVKSTIWWTSIEG
jgi:hypothetical protein